MDLFAIPYFPYLIIALAAVFTAREYVTYHEIIKLKYVFTPLVTAIIAGLVILSMHDGGITTYRVLVLSALICSIVADTMLMVVEVSLMEQGIVYFMMGHVMYIAAFSLDYDFSGWNVAVASVLLVILAMFYRGIRGAVGKLRIPILVYAVVLCTMLFFALSQFNKDFSRKEVLLIVGALLFVMSDFLLAYLSFIKPHRRESVIVWAVYAPGQFLIALSCFS
ncbi:MAG: lysoplasmalogenase [Spirochaetes bacterium]|nr:lysoplasmalogenase [Spirochaetota bacterium]